MFEILLFYYNFVIEKQFYGYILYRDYTNWSTWCQAYFVQKNADSLR